MLFYREEGDTDLKIEKDSNTKTAMVYRPSELAKGKEVEHDEE